MSPAPLRVWRESWLAIALQAVLGSGLIWLAILVYETAWWRQMLALTVGYLGFRVTSALIKDLWRALLPRAAYERHKDREAAKVAERLAPFAEPGDFDLLVVSSPRKKALDIAGQIRYVTGETSGRAAVDLAETPGGLVLNGRSESNCKAAAVRLENAGATIEIRATEEREAFSSAGDEKSSR